MFVLLLAWPVRYYLDVEVSVRREAMTRKLRKMYKGHVTTSQTLSTVHLSGIHLRLLYKLGNDLPQEKREIYFRRILSTHVLPTCLNACLNKLILTRKAC